MKTLGSLQAGPPTWLTRVWLQQAAEDACRRWRSRGSPTAARAAGARSMLGQSSYMCICMSVPQLLRDSNSNKGNPPQQLRMARLDGLTQMPRAAGDRGFVCPTITPEILGSHPMNYFGAPGFEGRHLGSFEKSPQLNKKFLQNDDCATLAGINIQVVPA